MTSAMRGFSFLLAVSAALAGCGKESHNISSVAGADAPPPLIEVRLWSEDHPLLAPFDVVLDGCRQWWPNSVDCVLTDSSDATMHIDAITPEDVVGADQARMDVANCLPDAEGKKTLAISKGGGWMEIYPKCFEILDMNGALIGYNTAYAATVVTHEVGHELGMPHVERVCTEHALKVGDDLLCGEAVMNPYLDLATPAPTPVDDLMFRVFVETVQLPAAASGACVYTMP